MLRAFRLALVFLCVFSLGLALGLGVPAYAAVRSAKIASVADDGNATKVQPSDLDSLTPGTNPQQNDWYWEVTGQSGSHKIALKFFDEGAYVTVCSVNR